MTKYLIGRLFGLFAFFLLGNFATAQQVNKSRGTTDLAEIMDNGINSNTAAPGPVVTEKALQSFKTAFKNSVNATWYQHDKHFLAKFETDGKKQKALFTRNGAMIYSIAYGSEKDLPAELRKQVKLNYFEYAISTVIEVHENSRTIWVVCVEDEASIVTLRLENGNMEEVQLFKKS